MPAVWGPATHAKIASGQTVSGEVDLRGMMLYMIQLPAAFTGTTLSFQVAEVPTKEGGVYSNTAKYLSTLAATAFTITGLTQGDCVIIPSTVVADGLGNCMLKIVSGSAEGADRDIILYTQPY